MISYTKINLFESRAQVLVNAVNTIGVMGKGIAFEFKKLYPDMFAKYQMYCKMGLMDVGKLQLYKTESKWILNFPTKKNWRHPSRLEYIEAGLKKFADTYQRLGIYSISFPMLGCGNGGLPWDSVRSLMEEYLEPLPSLEVFIHVVNQENITPEHLQISNTENWLQHNPNFLSSAEFIALLRSEFTSLVPKTLDNHGKPLEVTWKRNDDEYQEEGISIQGENFEIHIPSHTLVNLWSELKNKEVVRSSTLPEHLVAHDNVVMEALSLIGILNVVPPSSGKNASGVGLKISTPAKANTNNRPNTTLR